MLKWVVTRGPSGTAPRVFSTYPQNECCCNKENLPEDIAEMENNNSYTFYNLENRCDLKIYQIPSESKNHLNSSSNRRLNLETRENNTTPLTSRNPISGRAKKLRTRRERNKTLINRLSATSITNLSEIVTPRPQMLDPVQRDEDTEEAQLLQHLLNSNRLFNEREVKSPEEPSPLENGHQLCRQRAVRRKHGKTLQRVHHQQPHVDPYDSGSFFNCFVFRELAQDMLI